MIRRLAAFATVSMAAACVGPRDPETCAPAPECPLIDEEATADDVRVVWAADETLVMTLGDTPTDVTVVGGETVFTPDPADPDCLEGCAITLKRLRVQFDDVYFVSSEDAVSVRELELSFRAPAVLEKPSGLGSIVPAGTPTHTCAKVQDVLTVNDTQLTEDGFLLARAENEELTFEAHVPLHIDASTKLGCRQFQLELSGSLSGATPFDQNPIATVAP